METTYFNGQFFVVRLCLDPRVKVYYLRIAEAWQIQHFFLSWYFIFCKKLSRLIINSFCMPLYYSKWSLSFHLLVRQNSELQYDTATVFFKVVK